MDVLHRTKHGIVMFFSDSLFQMDGGDDSLLKSMFIYGFCASHLIFLLVLSIVWLCKRFRSGGQGQRLKTSSVSHYKSTLSCCFALALVYLLQCTFSYFWTDEMLATQLDLILRVVVWFAISAYLHLEFSFSSEKKFPTLFRIWWSFYFLMAASCLVIDIIYCGKHGMSPTYSLVFDFVLLVISLYLCYAGFVGKKGEEESVLLEEPLLNAGIVEESCKRSAKSTASPFSTANFLSRLTFSWTVSLLEVGNKKRLDLHDIPQLADDDSANRVFSVFKNKLQSDVSSSGSGVGRNIAGREMLGKLKLIKSLLISMWKEILWTGLLSLVWTLSNFVGPFLIDTFVQYLSNRREYANEGYLLVSAFISAKVVGCLAERHWFFRSRQIAIRARAALTAMIYQKGLSLSNKSRQGRTSGEIINFMSVDADRIAEFVFSMHDLWLVPVQVTLALLILYKNLGLASLAALAGTVVITIINVPLGKLQENNQDNMMTMKDKRMKATSEIFRNMKILKLQGWEMKFLSKITDLRKNEENWLKKYVYTSAMITFLLWCSPIFISVLTFGACVILGISLESGKVLSALATFGVLQDAVYTIPNLISVVVQSKVSLDRIVSLLCLEDLHRDVVEKLPRDSEVAVEISNGNFSWDVSSANHTLKDLNFQVSQGMRVAVCGTVGSGKSSLLSCILGEVPKISGTIKIKGRKAYVAQSPWIQSGTIEDNILFGKEMNRGKYNDVLEACSLERDLEILSFGDQTIIGERGINLSGGQKQRIQVARALYQDADLYLFDDPFSALDAHTAKHLFKECLFRFLGSKTVIFVTHQVEFLPPANLVLVMRDGRITQSGKYYDILRSGTDLSKLVGAHKLALSVLGSVGTASDIQKYTAESLSDCLGDSSTVQNEKEKEHEKNGKIDEMTMQKGQLIQEEERHEGKVTLSVYWKYITTSYGGALVPFILLIQVLVQLLQTASNYWMAWAAPVSKDVTPPVGVSFLILVYVALALGSALCFLVRDILITTTGYKTATILFNKMHLCIFRAPMSFFDATPSGRILNRASTDQSEVDTSLPYHMGSFSHSVIQLLATIAVMSQVAWQVFLIFIPVVGICFWYQQYYIPTARELARLIGVCKAPIIQHFAESLSGSTTIRSFDQESRFMNTNFHLIDDFARLRFYNSGAREWIWLRMDMLASMIFAFSLVVLEFIPERVLNPGVAGLAVTYGLTLNNIQTWVLWTLNSLITKIVSVERIFQYTCIPSEPPLVVENNRPHDTWPSLGEVDIRDLQVMSSVMIYIFLIKYALLL